MKLSIPTRRLLSIDPSSRGGLGIAISEIGELGMVNLYANTVDLSYQAKLHNIKDTHYERSMLLSKTIASFGKAWSIEHVVCEGNYYRGLPQPFKVLTQVVESIRLGSSIFLGHGDIEIIDPTTVKMAVGVKSRGTDKEDMRKAVLSGLLGLTLLDEPFYLDMSEHAIDAIAIGYAHFIRSPEYEYFKTCSSARHRINQEG